MHRQAAVLTGQFALQTTRHAIQLLAPNLQMVSVGLLRYIALRCILVLRGGGEGGFGGELSDIFIPFYSLCPIIFAAPFIRNLVFSVPTFINYILPYNFSQNLDKWEREGGISDGMTRGRNKGVWVSNNNVACRA